MAKKKTADSKSPPGIEGRISKRIAAYEDRRMLREPFEDRFLLSVSADDFIADLDDFSVSYKDVSRLSWQIEEYEEQSTQMQLQPDGGVQIRLRTNEVFIVREDPLASYQVLIGGCTSIYIVAIASQFAQSTQYHTESDSSANEIVSDLTPTIPPLAEAKLQTVMDQTRDLTNALVEGGQAIYSELSSFSLGEITPETNVVRYLPVRIYLETGGETQARGVTDAVRHLCSTLGFEIAKEYPDQFGSFWKTMFARTKDCVSQPKVTER